MPPYTIQKFAAALTGRCIIVQSASIHALVGPHHTRASFTAKKEPVGSFLLANAYE